MNGHSQEYFNHMNKCIHANCKAVNEVPNRLCDFHREELENNGKPGHWTCSWCTEYADKQEATRDMEHRYID
jgi:hypothetical protein